MKAAVIISLLALTACVSATPHLADDDYLWLFRSFQNQFAKEYHPDEISYRFKVFKDNVDYIRDFNTKSDNVKLAINQFADLTQHEWARNRPSSLPRRSRPESTLVSNSAFLNATNLPYSIDWRERGAVTDVPNQGMCGSSWAFAATGALEGIHQIKTGKLVALSNQQLIDCSTSEGNLGCCGGWMDSAFKYVIKNGGICADNEYPYFAQDGTCKTSCAKVATIDGFRDLPANNEDALQAAVAQQPVAVAIESDSPAYQFYSGGVFDEPCGTRGVDHGALVVGYGTSPDGKDYWIVKNWLGPSWGLNGYILLKRGSGSGNPGTCGITTTASYPIIN